MTEPTARVGAQDIRDLAGVSDADRSRQLPCIHFSGPTTSSLRPQTTLGEARLQRFQSVSLQPRGIELAKLMPTYIGKIALVAQSVCTLERSAHVAVRSFSSNGFSR